MLKNILPNVALFAFVTTMSVTTIPSPQIMQEMRQAAIYQLDDHTFPAPPPDTQERAGTHIPGVISHGPRTDKRIALTFDADMNPYMKRLHDSGTVPSWYNTGLIQELIRTNTKATLFLSGMWIEMYPEVTKELANNSLFELSNHSYSHPSFDGHCYGLSQLPDSQDEAEIERTQKLLRDVAGVDNSYFRFPGGCYGKTDLEIVAKLGMQAVHWDVVGDDGFTTDTQHIIQNVLNRTQNGSIIVLHMHGGSNAPKTAEAVSTVISELTRRGYTFVKVSELLDQ